MGSTPEPGPMGGVVIRPEDASVAGEVARIAALLEATFGETIQRRLVEAIRTSDAYLPEAALVATRADEIIGYVMASRARLVADGGWIEVASLAPLAVARRHQGEGVGGALLAAVVAVVDRARAPFLALEGDPAYYRRHGFEPGVALGITTDLPDAGPPGAVLVRRLSAHRPGLRGRLEYPPAFAATLEDVP